MFEAHMSMTSSFDSSPFQELFLAWPKAGTRGPANIRFNSWRIFLGIFDIQEFINNSTLNQGLAIGPTSKRKTV